MKAIIMKTKKQYIARLVLCMLLAAAAFFGGAKQKLYALDAPSGTVGGLRQTGATTNSVDIQFNALLDTQVQYEVRVSTAQDAGYTALTTTSANFATLSGLSAGNTYYVKVVPFYVDESGTAPVNVYGTESSPLAVVTTPASAPITIIQTGSGSNYISVNWSPVAGASGYYVDYCLSDSTSAEKARTASTSTSANLYGVIASKTYTVYITPYRVSAAGFVAYDSASAVSKGNLSLTAVNNGTPAGKVSGFSQTETTTSSVQIAFKKLDNASVYYSVQISQNAAADFEERAVVTEGKYTFSDLKAGTTYYVRVIPFYQNWNFLNEQYDRVYGTASDVFAIATSGGPKGKVKGLTQTAAAVDSAQITFKTLNDENASYSVQLSKSASGSFHEAGVVTDGEYTFSELKSGSTYYVRVVPFYQNKNASGEQEERLYGTATAALKVVTVPSIKSSKIVQTKATKTGFTVTWEAVEGATGYYVDYYCAGKSEHKTKTVTQNSVKLTKLAANQEYHVYVTPFRKSSSGFVAYNENNYIYKYNIPVKPSKAAKPKLEKFWGSLGKINASTKKIASADGYQYQLYTAYKDTDTKIATASSTSYSSADIKSTKLKNASVFKVRVRAYITVQGKKVYGGWSDWTYVSNPQKVSLAKSNGKIRAGWSKVKGADRYLVYVSTDKNGGFKKCVVTDKTSCLISSYGKSSIKSGTSYYVYVVPQVKDGDVYVSTGKRDAVSEIK